MKYDLILGNPPFSRGNMLLYPAFFEKALELADVVHMIVPFDASSNSALTKAHIQRVKRHSIQEPENVSHHFPQIAMRNKIHYVAASRHQNNKVPEYVDPIDSMPLLYPERDRLTFISGTLNYYLGHEDPKGPEVIWKVNKPGIVTKRITQELHDKINKYPNPKWRVIINYMPSGGKFNCEIVNDKRPACKVYYVEVSSKAKAQRLKAWLTSDVITAEMKAMLDVKGVFSISQKMIRRLPTYET